MVENNRQDHQGQVVIDAELTALELQDLGGTVMVRMSIVAQQEHKSSSDLPHSACLAHHSKKATDHNALTARPVSSLRSIVEQSETGATLYSLSCHGTLPAVVNCEHQAACRPVSGHRR